MIKQFVVNGHRILQVGGGLRLPLYGHLHNLFYTLGTDTRNKRPLVILLVEDDQRRFEEIIEMLPTDFRIVHVQSAGRAIGAIESDSFRKKGHVYAGIMLDHDLQNQALVAAERSLDGRSVIKNIISHFSNKTPILVHSMNLGCAPEMVGKLESAGFDVSRIPFRDLSKETLTGWLEEVRENWEDLEED